MVRAAAAAEYTAQPGPYAVASLEATWTDAARGREVPVKIYYPAAVSASSGQPCPVIIFSHGLGGSRDGYAYLGEHWASYGYVTVHLQHHGSDSEVLRSPRPLKALRTAAADPQVTVNRPLDVTFAIDRLTVLNTDNRFALHGRLDLQRIGVAGHSYGAYTTMAIAGAHNPIWGVEPRYRDPRVKAAIAMSTPNTRGNEKDAAFAGVTIPVFHMTGTEDGSSRAGETNTIVGDTKAPERLRPYQHTTRAPAYLLVFTGGDHMVFSGRLTARRPTDQPLQDRILAGSTAFWDAWLRESPSAKTWLDDGGFSRALGPLGTFEHKPARP